MQISHNDSFKTNQVVLSLLKTLQCFHFSLTENTKVPTVTHKALHDLPHYLSDFTPPFSPPSLFLPYQPPCCSVDTIKLSPAPFCLERSSLIYLHGSLFGFLCLFSAMSSLTIRFRVEFPFFILELPYPIHVALFSIQVIIICILYVLIICLVLCLYPFTRMQA